MSKMMIHCGDCLDILPTLDPASIDTCVTDPPYGLKFMGKDWDDGVPGKTYWEAVLRVLKPGGMCLAFGGTRTFHRLMCAIEDAGFQLRDTIMWVYGSGFPKSHNISKAIDKTDKTDARLWDGWGTALKPAWEPVIVAMKPLDGTYANNAQVHGVAGLNVDGGRVVTFQNTTPSGVDRRNKTLAEMGYRPGDYAKGTTQPSTPPGRWPANLIHDGSEEVVELFPEGVSRKGTPRKSAKPGDGYGMTHTGAEYDDKGSAARFFYCAKANKKDKGEGNIHPTVKPSALMEYLCRLTATPTGGVVLDPFAGSGSTGVACMNIGRDFVGCELDPDYYEIAKGRLGL